MSDLRFLYRLELTRTHFREFVRIRIDRIATIWGRAVLILIIHKSGES